MTARITLTITNNKGKVQNCDIHGLTLQESFGELEETVRQLLQKESSGDSEETIQQQIEIDDDIKFRVQIKNEDSDWMKLDISDSDANLASCNIHDGDTVAFEEVAGIELESGAVSGDANVGHFYVANATDEQYYIQATPDTTAPTEIQGKSFGFGGLGIGIAEMSGYIGDFLLKKEKVPLHTPEPKIETSKCVPPHRHLRIPFTINNPKNPKPCNIQIGIDEEKLETKEVIKNGFGIILTPHDGIQATQKIDKAGKNAWKPWSVPPGEDSSTFSYQPHQLMKVGDTCSVCRFERKQRPRSLLDKVMNRNK